MDIKLNTLSLGSINELLEKLECQFQEKDLDWLACNNFRKYEHLQQRCLLLEAQKIDILELIVDLRTLRLEKLRRLNDVS